jgi:hypothetical protein
MTPLSWCIVVSTVANVLTAALIGWFLLAKPYVHVTGGVGIDGSVSVDGTVRVRPANDDTIFKIAACEQTSELYGNSLIPVIHCTSLDQTGQNPVNTIKSYGLSVVPHSQ